MTRRWDRSSIIIGEILQSFAVHPVARPATTPSHCTYSKECCGASRRAWSPAPPSHSGSYGKSRRPWTSTASDAPGRARKPFWKNPTKRCRSFFYQNNLHARRGHSITTTREENPQSYVLRTCDMLSFMQYADHHLNDLRIQFSGSRKNVGDTPRPCEDDEPKIWVAST